VVRDQAARREAIDRIAALVKSLGLAIEGTIDSPVHGPAGNIEALLVAKH